MRETNGEIKQPALTSAEATNLLIELSGTKYWDAIHAYYNGLWKEAEGTILSVDPFKEPTQVARKQGFIQALPYLRVFVEIEKTKRANKEKEG